MDDSCELSRIQEIIWQIRMPGYGFIVEAVADEFSLQVFYDEPDVMSGVRETQRGRRWVFPAGQTVGQIVQTAFKAVLTSLEHRAREQFAYRGRPVLNQHLDIEQVWNGMADRQVVHQHEVM